MGNWIWPLSAAFIALAISCVAVADTSPNASTGQPLSVQELITHKDSLFGTEVAVRGYLAVDFENINLYESRKDFKLNNRHCVTVGVNKLFQRKGKKYNHQVVTIRGLLKQDYVEKDAICLSCCSDYAILPSGIGKN
jgi:hypothetical protein